ncbi:WAT1-related protein At3g18200-like [Primulina huaijiensis]|uniref:WAT1-related protein At3g18200-like n=1 Tax=Primulina huaijiensis TaxID=1492673 RepID=UPI003CC6F91A
MQAPIVKKYPAKLSLTTFTFFFGLIQFLFIAAFAQRDPKYWQIQSNEEIFTILYAGFISSGIVISLQTWCIQKGGPVFVASFQPAQTVLVPGMAFIILGDQLYSGYVKTLKERDRMSIITKITWNTSQNSMNFQNCKVIGAVLIIVGLNIVLWDKAAAETNIKIQHDDETLTKHLPLSNNKGQECPGEADIP